jgi:hypothetical protein
MRTFALLLLVGTVTAAAADPAPPIRPGLWESRPIETLMDGQPLPKAPPIDLQQLPPQVRAQMQKQMQAQGIELGAGGSVKHCISADMLKRQDWGQAQGGCQITTQSHEGNTWRWQGRCQQPPGQMQGSTRFNGDTAYLSEVKMTTQRGGKTQVMQSRVEARWLGADCGAVRPLQPPKTP